MPDFKRLEKNILDNIFEAQVKLGFDGRAMSLNYTTASLAHLLGEKLTPDEIRQVLADFSDYSLSRLGQLTYSEIKNGFCIAIPPEGTKFVHSRYDGGQFISSLVGSIREHRTLEEILDIFHSFSDSVSVTEMNNDEFKYLVYFKNGIPDDYRYCLSVDEEIDGSVHVTYHRFIREDYEDLRF